MAKYDTTKYYWLQLKEDFFDEDAIDWLEEQPNGKEYSLFYLKLCLKSLRSHGVLYRQVGNMIIPYDHIKLGELTKTNPDTVMVAMNLLLEIGLVEKLEDGKLFLTQVSDMIGSQSKSAFKKQQQRLAKNEDVPQLPEGGQGVDKCPPKIEKEIEIELEKELEEEQEQEIKTEKAEKPKRKKESTYDAIISELVFDEEVKATIYEFIKMRKLIKKPMTDFALKKLINKLNKITSDPTEQVTILEKSINSNWLDIYPPREEQPNKANKPSNAGGNVFLDILND